MTDRPYDPAEWAPLTPLPNLDVKVCRFCGSDWAFEDSRHDPLKMAGVKTQQGQLRHAWRGLQVAMTREVWLPFADLLGRVFSRLADLRKQP